jgi:DNA repair exonuclease SbcCD ATPase subunit
MIKTIAHLADIHIRKTPTRNTEYQEVFNKLIADLKKKKPDRIAIAGDLVHDYLDLQGEQLILAHSLLSQLAEIAPVRITRGNHDCRKKNLKRVDSIKAIVDTLRNDNVEYYNKTGFYVDDNVMWAVWHHGEKNNNPWKTKEGKKILAYNEQADYVTIDLFHDPINGCRSTTDFEMKSNSYYKVKDFKGDLSFFGDIHKLQYLDDDKTKAYCSSLIAQDITEGDDAFHGYLLWNIEDLKATEVQIGNNYSYHNVRLTPYTDFDELDFEIENPTKHMTVRFVWGTLPQTRTKENERKVIDYLKGYLFKEKDNIKILHKNEFVEDDIIDVNEDITLENIGDEAVQQEIFREYLEKTGTGSEVIEDILALDEEILKEIEIPEDQNTEWNIIKFGGNNFMSYGSLDVDWRKMDGLFQITGENTAGKTTIMKIISYILFNKTLETENRVKHGDKRFVNNRNGAKFCDAYLVLESNGEYYGLKRRTDIKTNKSGEITGAPTALNYYILNSPDDEMTDDNDIEKLDEDRRQKTQKQLEAIIGSYDNFMRIVMTTSDTLNRILSNDMAVFIDSLLYDSGLDIFDKKLEGLKSYQKRVNEKPRVNCNVEVTTEQNKTMNDEIRVLQDEIKNIETLKLPDVQNRIEKGREYIETLTKKLYKIDEEIYNLDVDAARIEISEHKKEIVEIKSRKLILKQSIDTLQETYDEGRLNELITKRDEHKQTVYEKRVQIKEEERSKSDFEHRIEILNGKIFTLKKEGAKLKEEIEELKNSKICSQCGQVIDKQEHKDHIAKSVKDKETEMFGIAKEIKEHQHDIDTDWKPVIKKCDENIERINAEIVKLDLEMEDVLTEIGTLTNEKNDVERRNVLQTEFNQIPTLIKNEELNIEILEQKIGRHENSLKQIEENKRIEKGIDAAKKKVYELGIEESDFKEDVYLRKTSIGEKQKKIKENEILISDFKEQEHRDMVLNLYKKCVHRDGIPRQMLSNYIIPKINVTLDRILSVAAFRVWLDADDLRPKLAYNDRPESIIDCISASGKERTFSSIVLKFGLNQINVKAKPTMFLLDEVMNKLDENAVEEFKEILQLIKSNMKKVLVIEHTHEINPDYLINVTLDENGISSMSLE